MHDDDLDPEHAHFEPSDLPEDAVEDIEGLEMFTIRSVGIDIGSSTSHLVFSHLTLRREGAAFSSRFIVTERKVLYRSKILLTPYLTPTLVNADKVREFFREAYREAGMTAARVDTGAVVITGEALKKENAKPIVEDCAKDSGKFICVSAGPNHEALLAAYGCGAVALSKAENATILNVDLGGGTTKFALIRNGIVAETGAVSVGARLIAFDGSGVVTRIEEPARPMMKELGIDVALGKKFSEKAKESFAELMSKILFEVIEGGRLSPLARDLMVTAPLPGLSGLKKLDGIVFSGGVSEYVYGHEKESYGDLGPLLGRSIRKHLDRLSGKNFLRK
ncbi:MAG: ethanolamine ammonia-lyase reactivating factor EutA, partial [Candidatus Binatia bacterium]